MKNPTATTKDSTPSFFQQFKRFLQMRAPEKHDVFMWRQLRKAMDELDYNYMANDKNRSMQLNFVDVKSRDLEIVLRVPYLEAIWNPQAIKEACYWQIHMHEKCQLAMEYMIESGEDPVFVFGYIMNADKDK